MKKSLTLKWVEKIFVRPEIFIYAAIFFFAAAFFVLSISTGNDFEESVLSYYKQANQGNIFLPAFVLMNLFIMKGIVIWITAGLKGTDPAVIFSKERFVGLKKGAVRLFKDAIIVGIPFLIAFYSLSFALGELNVFNSTRLVDEMLAQWDIAVTGTFLPLSIVSLQHSATLISAIATSFTYLVSGISIFGLYFFQANQKLFREAAGAFFLGLMISFGGWALFPVMSPHDRYIDNVYDLPISSEIQPYVDRYEPQEEVQQFLDFMRENKQGLSVMPTSTFPSAHVAWATLLVYYSWRIRKWLAIVSLPIAILSSLGTFFFAQHYFVDLPAGIVVAVVSIAVARYLAKKQEIVVANDQNSA